MLHISLLKCLPPFILSVSSFCNFLDRFVQFGQNMINGILNMICSVLQTYSLLPWFSSAHIHESRSFKAGSFYPPPAFFFFFSIFNWTAVLYCLADKQSSKAGEVSGSLLLSKCFIRDVSVTLLLNSQKLFTCQASELSQRCSE